MSAMELVDQSVPAKTSYIGNHTAEIGAGKLFKITLPGDEILKVKPPSGKQWQIKIFLEVIETDA